MLTLLTAPAEVPLTLAELKAQARVTSGDEDAVLMGYLAAATAWIDGRDGWLGRQLITATWDLKLDAFPWCPIRVPLPPLQSITSIEYIDPDGAEQTLASNLYQVAGVGGAGRIVPAFGEDWPTTRDQPEAVTIRFVAGYGAASDVPEPIRQALLMLATFWFDHRDAAEHGGRQVLPVPYAVDALLAPFRAWS